MTNPLRNTRHFIGRLPWWVKYIVIPLVVLLIAFRLVLPYIVLKYVNKTLADLPGYYGHVEDIDIHLLRGAYVIKNLEIQEETGDQLEPFFFSPNIDLSIQWSEVFRGSLVGEIELYQPQLNLVYGAQNETINQTGEGVDWQQTMRDLFPLKINRLEVEYGKLNYYDAGADPILNLFIDKINGSAVNLTNSKKLSESMVADMNAAGLTMGEAPTRLHMDMDPLSKNDSFNLDFQVEELALPRLNNFMRHYLGLDAEKGQFNLYMEITGKSLAYHGYVKPIMIEPKIFSLRHDNEGFPAVIWEAVGGLIAKILENRKEDQVATTVEIYGDLSNPDYSFMQLLTGLLKNAFIQALPRELEYSIN